MRSEAGAPTAAIGTAVVSKQTDPAGLNINKVLAGAGAAATSAVVGSLFGAAGTVLGAALGSVVSTLAATIYERSLERTRATVKARIKLSGGRTVDLTGRVEVPAPRVAPGGENGSARVHVTPPGSTDRQPTMVMSPVVRPRRHWFALTAVTLGVFLVGLLTVTGVELLKGSTLTLGETGTSVGRVVDPPAATPDTTEPTGEASTTTGTPEPTETETTSTTTPTETSEPATDEPDGDSARTTTADTGDGPEDDSSDEEPGPDASPGLTPTPTPRPDGAATR